MKLVFTGLFCGVVLFIVDQAWKSSYAGNKHATPPFRGIKNDLFRLDFVSLEALNKLHESVPEGRSERIAYGSAGLQSGIFFAGHE